MNHNRKKSDDSDATNIVPSISCLNDIESNRIESSI